MRLRPTGRPKSDRLCHVWHEVEGVKMHAWESLAPPPSAPHVVLLHGLVISSRYMVPLAERLAPAAHLFVPDLPSHGRTEDTEQALSIEEQADQLVQWMDAVGIGQAHLIGNSAGCQVITALAVRHPQRVRRLVLIGPTVDPHRHRLLPQAWRWIVNAWREPEPPVRIMIRDFLDVGIGRSAGIVRTVLADRIEERLPLIAAPTLIIRGGRDPLAPQRWAEEAARSLPHGTLKVVPGVAHVVNYSSPEEVARLVMPFLELEQVA